MKALPLVRLLLSLSATVAADPSIGGGGSEMEDGMLLRGAIPNHDENEGIALGAHYKHFDMYLRDLAEELNISLNETRKFLLQRQDFLEHTRDIHEDANFLDAELAVAPDGEFILRYKNGDVPQKSWEGVDKFKKEHGDAVVNLVSTRLSFKDAHERGRRLSAILESKAYTSVGYEIYGDDIHVTAKQPQGQGQGQGMRLLSRADAASIMTLDDDHDDLIGLSLHLVGHDQEDPYQRLAKQEVEIYESGVGGTEMLHMDPENPFEVDECTSGFAVRHRDADKTGILTAGHCRSELKYRKKKKGGKMWVPMDIEHRRMDHWGDMAWYTEQKGYKLTFKGYFFVKDDVVTDDWALFPVQGSAEQYWIKMSSTIWCASRRKKKVFKFEVVSLSAPHPEGKGSSDHIVLRGNPLKDGDSGGPCWGYKIFKNTLVVLPYAVGIVTARKGGNTYITKIWNIERALGVEVITEDPILACHETEYPCLVPRSSDDYL